MSIFRREPEPARPAGSAAPSPRDNPQPAPASRKTATLVAEGTRVVGNILGATDVLVEGEVEGQLQIESRVTVGAGGRVKGEITARTVQVGGKVHGNVRATDRIEITTSGTLEGDVSAPAGDHRRGRVLQGQGRDDRRGRAGRRGAGRPEGRRKGSTMRVGIPREIKNHEYRVGMIPAAVHALVQAGHEVVVEQGAGAGQRHPRRAVRQRRRDHPADRRRRSSAGPR